MTSGCHTGQSRVGEFQKIHLYGRLGDSFCCVSKKRKHEIRGLGKHVLSRRFLETEREEEAGMCMFWWPWGQGQPSILSALGQVEHRAWLSLQWHRCGSWLPWLQPPPQDNNISIRKVTCNWVEQPLPSQLHLGGGAGVEFEGGLRKGQRWSSTGDEWMINKRGHQVCVPEITAGVGSACVVSYGHKCQKLPVCTTWKEPWVVVFMFLARSG